MVSAGDLRAAKQVLSARMLRAGLRGHVVGRSHTLRVEAAVASAGSNVHAVGIGKKIVNGQETATTCVRVYVVQRIQESLLPPRDLVPRTIDGVPTDVIESPPAFILAKKAKRKKTARQASRTSASSSTKTSSCSQDKQNRQRPLVGGISAAHFAVTAGTLSCFCRSTRQGDDAKAVFAMSNNHVFADVNNSAIGDDLYQPGPADGGTLNDHMAELHRFVPIALGGTVPNRVDAAIGKLLPDIKYRTEICSIGSITATSQAGLGTSVRKHGRTSGYTEGVVTDDSVDALVGMDHNDSSIVGLFQDQIRIETSPPYPAFGLGGDSGSLVVHRDKQDAVGLYFAGPPSGVYGLANHISDVLKEMEVEIL